MLWISLAQAVAALVLFAAPSDAAAVSPSGGPGYLHQAFLVQDSAPVERQLQQTVKDLYRSLRHSVKRSKYFVFNSPTWWWRRVQRMFWPLLFAVGALLLDSALLAEWKNNGLRVLTNYVPLMLYVYTRLFFSTGVSWITRAGVVAALVYGVWQHDLIADGRWRSLGRGKLDDLILIVLAVRAFAYSCPDTLVDEYAARAVALRNRVLDARVSARPEERDA